MVPAALIGLQAGPLFDSIGLMVRACGPSVPPSENPALELGCFMGVAAQCGRDKLTLVASEGISHLGAWLEQLIAESTGKLGLGLIPIDQEPLGPPEAYGQDRVFVHLKLDGEDGGATESRLAALEAAGHPVVRLSTASPAGVFQEFFRWEAATAIAGAVMGIDPFDQPDVEASKLKTRALTDAYEAHGALLAETPFLESSGIRLFADARNAAELATAAPAATLEGYLRAHFARARAGDYLALLAYLDHSPEHMEIWQGVRSRLLNHSRLATTLQFGPRFLHSTGQAYKGGPNSGVFLQITAPPARDLDVPGRDLTFGVIEAAQAQGDFAVLAERGRRLLRIDLGEDVVAGLTRLAMALERALS
jgi:transaldolase/glucose-6-phosphate isomerase